MQHVAAQPQASPRLHTFISPRPVPPVQSPTARHRVRVLSPTKPTLHLSPRKFHQLLQQQRQAVLRGMLPLSPIRRRPAEEREASTSFSSSPITNFDGKASVTWNPGWLPFPVDDIPVASAKGIGATSLSFGTTSLDAWLASFDQEILQYESLERFAQVKLPEAMAFCEKMEQQIVAIEERERLEEAASRLNSPSSLNGRTLQRGVSVARRPRDTTAMTRFPVRFRVAVFASLVERSIVAMSQSAALAHLKPWLLQTRQELFRAVFADYDKYSVPRKKRRNRRKIEEDSTSSRDDHGEVTEDSDDHDNSGEESTESNSDDEHDSEQECQANEQTPRLQKPNLSPTKKIEPPYIRFGPDTPRPLSFFLSRVPFILKLHDDTQRRATRFQRHQVVLRRIVQSLYRSLGSVFHAWKMYARQRREERLNEKGAQLTAMVVIQRGLVRTIFVAWSKCTLKTKLQKAHEREVHAKRLHDERVNDLYKELFLLREQNTKLERELDLARSGGFCEAMVEEVEEEDTAG